MAIALEKILALNIRDYCERVGKQLSDYQLQGVHSSIYVTIRTGDKPLTTFAEKVPDKAEVVVNYQMFNIGGGHPYCEGICFATGVALIPKE